MNLNSEAKIIITGSAGFIGSALANHLNDLGYENLYLVDALEIGDKFKNLVPLKYSDYWESDRFLKYVEENAKHVLNTDIVFHLGACSSTTESDNRYLVENNFEYTKKVANWTLESKARFVYASSAATYGNGSRGMDDIAADLHRFRPLNMYGYSKHMFDLYAQKRGMLDKVVGLKYFNVFGPNEWHKGPMRSLVCKAYEQVLETGKIKLFKSENPDYADGEQKRDFLYVKDAVKMTAHLGFSQSAKGLFNLGSGEANTWLTLANSIFSSMDREPDIEFIPLPSELKDKYQYYTKADISKLIATRYESQITPLPEAINDYVRNYLSTGKRLGE